MLISGEPPPPPLPPVPVNVTLRGFSSGSFEEMMRVAVLAPFDVGLKRAATVQDAPAPKVFFEHLSERLSN
jgi:hypothetical protein